MGRFYEKEGVVCLLFENFFFFEVGICFFCFYFFIKREYIDLGIFFRKFRVVFFFFSLGWIFGYKRK